ncbi:MAG: hypothetical protein EP319_13190 [Deltaproteobacteria bacterium]|nr:MAG: hypothetical protein EP319_13190 [Deltaproteobacteria bacterium]
MKSYCSKIHTLFFLGLFSLVCILSPSLLMAGEGDGVLKKYKLKISDPRYINKYFNEGFTNFTMANEGRDFHPMAVGQGFKLNFGGNDMFSLDFVPKDNKPAIAQSPLVLKPEFANQNADKKLIEIDVEVPNPANFDPNNPAFDKFTLKFTSIPTNQQILEAISRALNPTGQGEGEECGEANNEDVVTDEGDTNQPRRPAARPEDLGRPKDSDQYPAAKGARMVMATFFQSCKAMDLQVSSPEQIRTSGIRSAETSRLENGSVVTRRKREVTNLEHYVNSHYLLSELNNRKSNDQYPGPQCTDSTLIPPIYGYGAKADTRNDEINLFSTRGMGNSSCTRQANRSTAASTEWTQGVDCDSASVTAIDCSGLVSMALMSQGLRFWPKGNDDNKTGGGTSTLKGIAQNANSCIAPPELTVDNFIQPGDMLNRSGSHIVMVDVVGEDPMGIKKVLASEDKNCASISMDDFDMTFIHSGATGNMGPARIHTKALANNPGGFWNGFVAEARRACEKFKKNEAFKTGTSARVGILRHKSDNPECKNDPEDIPKMKGSECVQSCI